MARFYIDIYNDTITIDEEGVDLLDRQVAHAYAVTATRSLAAHSVQNGHLTLSHRIEILDEYRRFVASVTFADVVEIRT